MHGKVRLTTVNAQTQHIEIVWTITSADGKIAGVVRQPHDLPKGSLDTYWGDVAVIAGSAAASGVKEVLDNNIGKKPLPGAAPAPAPPPGPPPVPPQPGKTS